MAIEHDIKQNKFRNEWQKATINIIYTSSWINERMKSFFDEYELTSQQFNVLRILRGSMPHPLSTQEIRSRMLDKKSDASRIVERLLKKKLITKKTNKEDKRLLDIAITNKGLDVLFKIDEQMSKVDKVLHNLEETEAKTLNQLLDKIRG